eukprot:4885888-Pyramimonas_sp.AAC.1
MFPKDVGFTLEGSTLPLTFLQCNILPSSSNLPFEIHASAANHEFACGDQDAPKFAKYPAFFSLPRRTPN